MERKTMYGQFARNVNSKDEIQLTKMNLTVSLKKCEKQKIKQ